MEQINTKKKQTKYTWSKETQKIDATKIKVPYKTIFLQQKYFTERTILQSTDRYRTTIKYNFFKKYTMNSERREEH